MRECVGDIWQVATPKDIVVVPTNIGWKSTGPNVMGKGLARDAARRWPHLPAWYGEYCRECVANVERVDPILLDVLANQPDKPNWRRWCRALVLFPVKPLNATQPFLSWRQDASLELITRGLPVLADMANLPSPGDWVKKALFLVPALGCGNGNLEEEVVVPLMKKLLPSDRFVFVRLG